jgi:hypothetical protein
LLHAKLVSDSFCQAFINVEEMRHHTLADNRCLDLGELEGQRHGDMLLLRRGLTVEELSRLAVVVGEALCAQTDFLAFLRLGERPETVLRRFPRAFAE